MIRPENSFPIPFPYPFPKRFHFYVGGNGFVSYFVSKNPRKRQTVSHYSKSAIGNGASSGPVSPISILAAVQLEHSI
jgi:hypothetical protein